MVKVIPNLRLFLVLLFLSLLIFFLDSLHFLDFLNKHLFYLTNPISFGLYNSSQQISRQFHFVFLARKAGQENKALKEQIGELLSENANLKRRLNEAEAQVSQKIYLDPRTYNLIPARPVGLTRYLKIDRGEDQDIKVGQVVVFKDNYIGKVIAVSQNAANVQLLSDPSSKVAAFSLGRQGRAKGVVVGQFGTDYLLDKILHEEHVENGDLIYSEGTEGILPRGLILGKVTEVHELPNEVFKQAKVQPVFDITDLDLVFVISE